MLETTVNKLPYPTDADGADGPTQIKALAEGLDALKWGSRNLKPTLGRVVATADLALTAALADVPGAVLDITPAVPSLLFVWAEWTATIASDIGVGVTIKVDGTDQAGGLVAAASGFLGTVSVQRSFVVSLTAAKHTIKQRAVNSVGKVAGTVKGGASQPTGFSYLLLAS